MAQDQLCVVLNYQYRETIQGAAEGVAAHSVGTGA